MKKLKVGQTAPNFTAKNYSGSQVNLKDYRGKKVLLSFHAFASCPFCNLRINELKNEYPRLNSRGLEMIHVFPSPGEAVGRFAGKDNPPFPIIGDPEKKLFTKYGLQKSLAGMFGGFLKVKRLIRAFKVVSFVDSMWNNDSDMRQLPADFLIDENGIIQEVYYAKTTSDNMPMEQIESFLGLLRKVA
jgi:thioredoxin-dependent peroxiredoxin